jgi:hypothetical protein
VTRALGASPSTLRYRPESGSLAARVLAFFALNPEEELTSADIAQKFDVASSSHVSPSLTPPMAHGLLARGPGGAGYRPGPAFAAWVEHHRHEGTVRAVAQKPQRIAPPPPLDPFAVPIAGGVIRPTGGRGAPMTLQFQVFTLLERLEPNTHAELPWAYRHLISAAATRYRKTHPDRQIGCTRDEARGVVVLNRYA